MVYHKEIHRFSLFTAVSTFVLIFIGGLVTSTGSGLSVPDWPTTFGENMFTYPLDKWVGGIKYEHGHRLFASFVGLCTLILAVWMAVKEERTWVRWMAFAALAAVITQGILGGLTVLFQLPTAVSMAHGMLAQSFFCLVSMIALVTSPWWKETETGIQDDAGKPLQMFSVIAVAAVFLQLTLGALLRHTYSGLSVPDFPLAYGQMFPSLTPDALASYNQQLIAHEIKWPGDTPVAAFQIVVHLMHRYWAYLVAALVFFVGVRIKKTASVPRRLRTAGSVLLGLIVVQFTFGILTILSHKEFIVTSLHVAIGALVLAACCLTTIMIVRLRWLALNGNSSK